jgi:hypothetical protein
LAFEDLAGLAFEDLAGLAFEDLAGLAFEDLAGFSSTTSSGWTSRFKPSRSAFLLARSAWASTIPDEWLFTPMPRETQRSSTSALVIPISRANS